jgi:hypothetical protein
MRSVVPCRPAGHVGLSISLYLPVHAASLRRRFCNRLGHMPIVTRTCVIIAFVFSGTAVLTSVLHRCACVGGSSELLCGIHQASHEIQTHRFAHPLYCAACRTVVHALKTFQMILWHLYVCPHYCAHIFEDLTLLPSTCDPVAPLHSHVCKCDPFLCPDHVWFSNPTCTSHTSADLTLLQITSDLVVAPLGRHPHATLTPFQHAVAIGSRVGSHFRRYDPRTDHI